MSQRKKAKVTRGRLSAFDLLPPECDPLIIWAAQALSDRDQTQVQIYAEFVRQAEELMAENGITFDIPSPSSFNRYSVRQARLTRRMDETRQLTEVLAEKFDAKASDDLTILTAETIKSLVFHMVADLDEGLTPQGAMQLAAAFKSALQASAISTDRRQKEQAEFDRKIGDAVTTVAKAKGLTAETAEAIKAEILGVGK
jgi:hypothetical protein